MKRSQSREHRRALEDRQAQANRPPEPEDPKIGTGRRPWPIGLKAVLWTTGAAIATGIVVPPINKGITDFLTPDNSCHPNDTSGCEEYNISDQPPTDSRGYPHEVAPLPEQGGPATLRAGEKLALIVCKGYVFTDEERNIQIKNPVVEQTSPSENLGLMPREAVKAGENNIKLGGAMQATEYSWIAPDGTYDNKLSQGDCAERFVVAETFGAYPNQTLALHEEGAVVYPQQPAETQLEGMVHQVKPLN